MIPHDLKNHYPEDYYSYNQKIQKTNPIKTFLQKQRCRVVFFNRGYKLNKLIKAFVPLPYEMLKKCNPVINSANLTGFNDPILDVGSGSNSWWLNQLRDLGFSNLVAIDPYIKKSCVTRGIVTKKEDISKHTGIYKLITLHHSFEHMPNQDSTLKSIRKLLTDDGICIIRIPTCSSYVWKNYGVNWVELDPPRHLYLHSLKSIELAAKNNGLKLFKTEFDSTEFEFIGSEQYKSEIAMRDENSYFTNPEASIFNQNEINEFKNKAKKVNVNKEGGRAAFFFKPA